MTRERTPDSNIASTSYSCMPGFRARMTSRSAPPVMAIARRRSATSAGLFRVRRLSSAGCASRTTRAGCPSAKTRMNWAPRVRVSVDAASAVAKSRRV